MTHTQALVLHVMYMLLYAVVGKGGCAFYFIGFTYCTFVYLLEDDGFALR